MFELSFVHPGFLAAGAAAASLPILLHLLLRQRARPVQIGSVRFLQSVLRQHRRRRRIRQWLLLSLRVLALLLLAALFARPYLDASRFAGQNREVVVLVDRSASMRSADGTGTVFDTALRAARREVAALPDNTVVHVGLFDGAGVAELKVEALGTSVEPGWGSTDFGLAFQWARDILVESERADREVVLVSDLQQAGGPLSGDLKLPDGTRVSVRDVGRLLTRNLAVEQCEAVFTEIRPGEPVTVRARLLNAGALTVKGVTVTLAIDGPQGHLQQEQTVDVAGASRVSVDFPLPIEMAGVYRGEVRIDDDDDFPFDDRRLLAFEALPPDRLLLVDGQQGRSVFANETYYLETALRLRMPESTAHARSFEIERIVWEDGEGFPDLAGFKVIVLANLSRLSAEDVSRLSDYVRSGGNLLIFGGDQVSPEQVASLAAARLISVRLGDEPLLGPFRITEWQAEHPALRPFADPQYGDLRRLQFREIQEVTPLVEAADVVMRLGQRPLLVEQAHGKGRSMLVATTADRGWSDWPQHRLYVPMVRQLLAYLTGQLEGRSRVVQETIQGGDQAPAVRQQADRVLVSNLEAGESRIARLTEEQLRESLGLTAEANSPTEVAAAMSSPPGTERPDETWTLVVWLLLAVLVVETLFATRVHN